MMYFITIYDLQLEKVTYTVILQLPTFADVFNIYTF